MVKSYKINFEISYVFYIWNSVLELKGRNNLCGGKGIGKGKHEIEKL